jgi:LacI family transcriptional regulator
MSITQKELAQKLNISQSLVARALNDYEEVSLSTRQLVQETARDLGYRPHRVGQALSTGRTHQIALCFPNFLGSSFYNAIIREFEILARCSSYELLVVTVDPTDERGNNVRFTADGAIFVGPADCLPPNIMQPVVTLQNQVLTKISKRAKQFDRVQFNLEQASMEAMQHLVKQGFRRIAYVAQQDMIDDCECRCYAYQTVLQKAGMQPEIISLPIFREELIRQRSHRVLKKYFCDNGFPDALFCCNDDIGMGAYRALGELGRNVPGETAVIGVDDLDYASYLNPPMSSVHMPIDAACKLAWEMLMRRIEDDALAPQFDAVEAYLEVRESSISPSLTDEDERVFLTQRQKQEVSANE